MKKILDIEGYLILQEYGWMPASNPKFVDFCRFHPEWSSIADCPLPVGTESALPSWVINTLAAEFKAEDSVHRYLELWELTTFDLSLEDLDSVYDEALEDLPRDVVWQLSGVIPGGEELPCDVERFFVSQKEVSVGQIKVRIVLDRAEIDLKRLEDSFDGSLSSLKLSQTERASVQLVEDADDIHGNSDLVFVETCGKHCAYQSSHTDDFAYSFKFEDFDEVLAFLEANQWTSESVDFLVECLEAYFEDWVVDEDEVAQQEFFMERLEALRT